MPSSAATVEHILDVAGLGERFRARKMFGEYGLYLDEVMVALVCDEQLFLKPTAATASELGGLPTATPYPNAKPHPLADALLDDPSRLRALLMATARALPAPKPRPARQRRRPAPD